MGWPSLGEYQPTSPRIHERSGGQLSACATVANHSTLATGGRSPPPRLARRGASCSPSEGEVPPAPRIRWRRACVHLSGSASFSE
eukprot:607906-Prymnesium_polylepis.1